MKIIYYITILLFALGQLGRISFYNQQINGYLYEIPLFLTLLYLVWRFKLEPVKKGFKHFKIIFWFIGILLISYLLNFFRFTLFQNLVAFFYLGRLILYLGFFGYLGYCLKRQPGFRQHVSNGLFIFSVLTIISSFVQYFLYPDLRNLFYLGWDPHLHRMFGVFFDTSVAAAIYGIVFLLFYKNYKGSVTLRLIFTFIFLIFFVLTFSRGAYIALILSVIGDFFSQKKAFLIFPFLIIFFLMVYLVPKPFGEGVNLKRTFTIESRLNDYKLAVEIWKNFPLLGVGYNRIRYLKPTLTESHAAASFSSSFLIILVTSGVFGILSLLGVLTKLWYLNKKARAIFLFLTILSFTDNIILHPFIMFLLGIVMVDK